MSMLLRILIVVIVLSCGRTVAAQNIEPTQRVVERLLVRAGDEICARAGDSAARYIVTDHPDAQWIAIVLRDPASLRACMSDIVDSAGAAQIAVVCRDVRTTYANTLHPDTVLRRVVVDLDAIDRRQTGRIYSVRLADTSVVARNDAAMLDSQQHMAAYGTVPARPTTLWEDIAQPVVFIAAAVVTVVLLFTVRSQ